MAVFTPWGILFHTTRAAWQNVRSLHVFRQHCGCGRSCLSAEHNFWVDRRAAGDLRCKLGLGHLGLCSNVILQSIWRLTGGQCSVVSAGVMWLNLFSLRTTIAAKFWIRWIQFNSLSGMPYCRLLQQSILDTCRLGSGFWQHLLLETFSFCWWWINWTRQICEWDSQKLLGLKHCLIEHRYFWLLAVDILNESILTFNDNEISEASLPHC